MFAFYVFLIPLLHSKTYEPLTKPICGDWLPHLGPFPTKAGLEIVRAVAVAVSRWEQVTQRAEVRDIANQRDRFGWQSIQSKTGNEQRPDGLMNYSEFFMNTDVSSLVQFIYPHQSVFISSIKASSVITMTFPFMG